MSDVRARDEQHEPHRHEQRHERRPRVLDDVVLERHDADLHARRLVHGVLGAQLPRDLVHVRLRLLERHARLEPAEHREEREIARRLVRVVELQRLPDLRVGDEERFRRQPQPEPFGHHADDGLIEAVEADPCADDVGIGAVAALPEPVAENDDLAVRPAPLPRR